MKHFNRWVLLGAIFGGILFGFALPYAVKQTVRHEVAAVALPVLQFAGPATSEPYLVRPGDMIQFTYTQMRRNNDCPIEVHVRWRDMTAPEAQIFSELTETRMATQADATADFVQWGFKRPAPDLPPGIWAYLPKLFPRGQCDGQPAIIPPPATFRVTP